MKRYQNYIEKRISRLIADGNERGVIDFMTQHDFRKGLSILPALLGDVPELEQYWKKRSKCSPGYRCYQRGCPNCIDIDYTSGEALNRFESEASANSRPKNPQIRAAQSVRAFYRFPEDQVWMCTINLAPVLPNELDKEIKRWRTELQKRLKKISPSTIAKGKFEDDPYLAENLDKTSLSKPNLLDEIPPKTIVSKLHIHVLLYVPDMNQTEVRNCLVRRFGEGKIVNLRSIQHRIKDGMDAYGIEGVARYSAKEHLNLTKLSKSKSLSDVKSALIHLLKVNRRSKNFSFNTKWLSSETEKESGFRIERLRRRCDLPREWGAEDIEMFLLDWDIDALMLEEPVDDKELMREALSYQVYHSLL